jgi:hypothetical protein
MVICLGWPLPATSSGLPAAPLPPCGVRIGVGHTSPPIWPCSDWGLPCRRCYQRRGGLLPHRFTLTLLTSREAAGRSLLCCPVHRLSAPRCYLAVCPVELGLSSKRPCDRPATITLSQRREYNLLGRAMLLNDLARCARASRLHPERRCHPERTGGSGRRSRNHAGKIPRFARDDSALLGMTGRYFCPVLDLTQPRQPLLRLLDVRLERGVRCLPLR